MPAEAPDERPPFPPLSLLLGPVSVLEAASALLVLLDPLLSSVAELVGVDVGVDVGYDVGVDVGVDVVIGAEEVEAGGRGAVNVEVTRTVVAAFR